MPAKTNSFRQEYETARQHLAALRQQLDRLPDGQEVLKPVLQGLAEALLAMERAHGDLSRQYKACADQCEGLEGERAFQGQREVRDVEVGIVKEEGEQTWTSVSAVPLPFADWRVAVATVDITERKRAEQALRRERDFSDAVLDTSGGLVVVVDREGRIVRFNRTCERITGYTFDEVRGQPFWDLFVMPEEVEPTRAAFARLATSPLPDEYDSRWRSRDGSCRWIRWSSTVLRGDGGALEYIVGTGIDVTGHREEEAQLQAALREAQQRQAENSALLAGARLILQRRTFAESARSILETCKGLIGAQAGYIALGSKDASQNEVVYLDSGGLPCDVDPAAPMPIRGLRGQVYRTGQPVYDNAFASSHWTELLPAGHVPVDNLLFAPLLMGGEVVGLLGLANKPGGFGPHDVRMAEAFGELAVIALQNSRLTESLEASEKRLRAVLETASAAIITADSRGQIASWNRKAEVMFGYSAGEMVGTPMIRIMPERFRADHYQGMGRALATGKTRLAGETVESVGARKDGSEFPLEMSLAAWQTAEGSFFTAIMQDISERKRVEEALRQANQSIEALIQASPLAIITLDSDLNVRLWNPAAERIFGWSEQEMLGRPYPLVPDARTEEYRTLVDRIWRGEQVSGFETQRERKDGALIDVAIWSSPLHGTAGQVGGLMAVLSDISQRKQAGEALRRYADEQMALYAVTSAVSAILDVDRLLATVLEAVLPSLEADAGWILLPGAVPDGPPRVVSWRGTPQELLEAETTQPLRDCPVYESVLGREGGPCEPPSVAGCPRLAAGVLADAGLNSYACVPLSVGDQALGVLKIGWQRPRPGPGRELRLLTVFGRQVGMALHNAQLYQAARQVDRLRVLSALDEALAATLDPRKVAEQTLHHVAASLEAPAGAVVLLPRPIDLAAEPQVYAPAHGWRKLEASTQQSTPWQALLDRLAVGPDLQPFPPDALAAIEAPGPLSRPWGDHCLAIAIRSEKELAAVLALGGRPTDRPFGDEDRALAQVAASHAGQAMKNAQLYAELKTLLLERDQTRAQLIQSAKMAALGRLVASLAHEINNPLQSVQGCLTLLEEELDGRQRGDKMDRYLDIVQREIERIASIVRRTRDFYRPAQEAAERVDLHAIAESVLNLTGKQLQHGGVAVERDWAADLPAIEANPDHLKQVILNLVLNAVDAMPSGGTLRIVTAADQMPGSGDRQPQLAVRITVRDTGRGMSPEVQARLFEPFFTTKEDGAGLGLPISYGIIQAHHGDIAVTSQEGVGTTFSILLPVVQP
jgi:PAS domain S-box-containing protein